MRQVESEGGHVDIPEDERDAAVGEGLSLLSLRHMLEVDALGRYRVNPRERLLLRYYANSVAHLLGRS
jgi:glycerol-3-phosphate O-acyltransferase